MEKKIWIGLTVLIILLVGTSFAWWYWNSTTNTDVSLTVDGVTVTFDGGQDITGVNLIPVSTKEKGKGVSFMENKAEWHGKAPNEEQYNIAISEL